MDSENVKLKFSNMALNNTLLKQEEENKLIKNRVRKFINDEKKIVKGYEEKIANLQEKIDELEREKNYISTKYNKIPRIIRKIFK